MTGPTPGGNGLSVLLKGAALRDISNRLPCPKHLPHVCLVMQYPTAPAHFCIGQRCLAYTVPHLDLHRIH